MALEIERKFLVATDGWKSQLQNSLGERFCQGYLSRAPVTVRVRTITLGLSKKAVITIKGQTTGVTRDEFEYDAPYDDAVQMLALCAGPKIEKTRFYVVNPDDPTHVWHVDVFDGDNKGLITAEIELKSETEKFIMPKWIGKEVSDDHRYYNTNLPLLSA